MEKRNEHLKITAAPLTLSLSIFESSEIVSSKTSVKRQRNDVVSSAPDGGWGWVVCAASFVCMVIIDGMLFSFGVFYIDLLNYFQAGSSKTALIGSLFMGMSMIGGPLASTLVNIFGIRKVTMAGSLLSFLSFGASAFAPSVEILAITYGFLGGLSVCMVYIPAILVIGFYFEKRRAFANGLSASGSGVGVFIYSPLCSYLQDEYTWKGAVLILAAITLHTFVSGMLFRPIKIRKHHSAESKDMKDKTDTTTSLLGDYESSKSVNGVIVLSSDDFSTHNVVDNQVPTESKKSVSVARLNTFDTSDVRKHDTLLRTAQLNQYKLIPNYDLYTSAPKLANLYVETSNHDQKAYSSVGHLAWIQTTKPSLKEDPYFKPLEKKDIFYSGSLRNIPAFDPYEADSDSDDSDSVGTSGNSCYVTPRMKSVKKSFYKVVGLDMLTNPVFVIIVVYHLLWTTHSTILTITPVYAMLQGVDKSSAALLLSVIGVTNTIGRIVAGLLADRPQIRSVWIVAAALIMGGLTCFCFPFSDTYAMLVAESAMFGLCMATWTSLRPIVLVELLGIDNLTNSLGLLALMQGVAFCIGPPLAGLIYDQTHSYTLPYILAGSAFVISGLICIPLPKLAARRSKRLREHRRLSLSL